MNISIQLKKKELAKMFKKMRGDFEMQALAEAGFGDYVSQLNDFDS